MPDDPAFLRLMYAAAAAGLARGWLLYIAGEPAAYLYCAIESGTAVHDQAGHDPAFADFAPAGVLQLEALRDLFGERGPKRFDFKFGDSRHKRPFATCGVPCIDLMLLRPSLAHRAATAALGTVDRAATIGKRGVARLGLERIARSVRR